MKIIELCETDSTNEYCKRADEGEDLTVIASKQTAGRGTKGRSFISFAGGLYISVMRHYSSFPAEQSFRILINRCVAVCRTLELVGLKPRIRWANDVLIGDKKISGTLIENTFNSGFLTRSIVGTGINIFNELTPEIEPIATTVERELGKKVSLDGIKEIFLQEDREEFTVEDYKKYTDWLGEEVTLTFGDCKKIVTALDILSDGRLKVLSEKGEEIISSAEVGLRLKCKEY